MLLQSYMSFTNAFYIYHCDVTFLYSKSDIFVKSANSVADFGGGRHALFRTALDFGRKCPFFSRLLKVRVDFTGFLRSHRDAFGAVFRCGRGCE